MKKVILKREDIHTGYLILVNTYYKIKEHHNMKIVSFNKTFKQILLEEKTNEQLQKVLKKLNVSNQIIPVSGFRDLNQQQTIYDTSLRDNGREFTEKYIALPNASEHQTGLAIDLALNKQNVDFIRPSFPYAGVCDEFRKLSLRYGFIERYQADKVNITKIAKEEWHFRYVGYPHSEIMHEKNLCLEEYINYVKEYLYHNNPFSYKEYEISYLPMTKDKVELLLEENEEISGNNVDGFIITKKYE